MTLPKSPNGHHPSPVIAAVAALSLLLAACDKGQPQATKPRANAPAQAPVTAAAPAVTEAAPAAGQYDANEALKERLARQEAATKLFDKAKPEPAVAPAPAPPPAAVAAKAPVRAPEPARAPAPVMVPVAATSTKAEPPRSEPVKPPEPVATPAPAPARPSEPVKLAAALPSAPAPVRLVSRVNPEFPREAIQAGASKGNVKARMTLDGAGNVTRVEVVEATPRRVFDRAVVRSLSQWRFNEGPAGRTVETEVDFNLAN